MKPSADDTPQQKKSTRPAITSVSPSRPPGNGTWTASNPALMRNRSAAQWVALPVPADAKVNDPALAAATNSGNVLRPLSGETTVTLGMVPNGTTAEKSRAGS